tara:strand:- start:21006 stop:21782 length:777 start_codon:yes stop_codon:yes gene_type:complete
MIVSLRAKPLPFPLPTFYFFVCLAFLQLLVSECFAQSSEDSPSVVFIGSNDHVEVAKVPVQTDGTWVYLPFMKTKEGTMVADDQEQILAVAKAFALGKASDDLPPSNVILLEGGLKRDQIQRASEVAASLISRGQVVSLVRARHENESAFISVLDSWGRRCDLFGRKNLSSESEYLEQTLQEVEKIVSTLLPTELELKKSGEPVEPIVSRVCYSADQIEEVERSTALRFNLASFLYWDNEVKEWDIAIDTYDRMFGQE